MDQKIKQELKKIANSIRNLSMDAIEKANSGHPGLPLGCAELGAYLYGCQLKHNPKSPKWLNRDRFVLSAGHGSMLLYSCLHLAGFDMPMEQIKNFRQLHSKTPGHPEQDISIGIEMTTGPLGHGIGNAVGMALSKKILKDKFNTPDFPLFDSKVYCLAGDGCMMEGAAAEASSFAGHLKLNNLVLIYDANAITLDGPLSESFSDDTKSKYRAYGWEVFEIDGHDFDAIDAVFSEIKQNQERPSLIVAHTIIGKGSPHKAGTHKVHGSPLGKQEVLAAKQALHLPEEEFYVPQSVYDFFKQREAKQAGKEKEWNQSFSAWAKKYPELFQQFKIMQTKYLLDNLHDEISKIEIKNPIATRSASSLVINYLADRLPFLYGGSADLSCSDMSYLKKYHFMEPGNYSGRNIKYGVREFAMGTIANGLASGQMILPFCATFLVFSDYMRNAIRIAAMSNLQVIYQLTHDSVFLGEDGPTHQPVEHLVSLRAIPRLNVIRPADANEVKGAWIAALEYKTGPTAIVLSRQNLPVLKETEVSYEEGVAKGAYIIRKEKRHCEYLLLASGSEVSLALEVADSLEKMDKGVRVVSFPCYKLFEKQEKTYRGSVLNAASAKKVSIEAGSDMGWYKYIGQDGISISINDFGISAPQEDIAEHFGFTVENILQTIL